MFKICAIILIIFIVIWSLFLYRKHYIYPNLVRKMKGCHKNIIKMLNEVLPYFEKNNINYFITDGTLLGFIRHNKKFIPYDDDIDLCVLETDNTSIKIEALSNDIEPLGYKIVKKFFGWAIYYKDPKVIGYIDLFILINNGDKYTLNEAASRKWPSEYFYEDEIFPLQQDYFEGVLVNLPNKPIVYLKRYYGEKALTECILTHFHQGNYFDRSVILLTNVFKKFRIDCI